MTGPETGGLPDASQARRRRYIDWARGVAVLVMIEAHTVDAWTRASDRSSHLFKNLIFVGGFAAPLFLWLAGLALALSAERALQRNGDRRAAAEAVCRRGLEIFILAFLFRLQAFIISPGSSLVAIFKVDILNVMGLAIVAAGLIWARLRSPVALVLGYGAAATAVAMLTPVVRVAPWVDWMPTWVQWYLRPAGQYTTFTLFPWSGFVFAGAVVGVLIARGTRGTLGTLGTLGTMSPSLRAERWPQAGLAGGGIALWALGLLAASLPTIYQNSSYWTTSPAYFAVRVGAMMLFLAALYAVEAILGGWSLALRFLERFGASSLFVYWVHMEFVYGSLGRPLRRNLSLWQVAVAYVAFCGLMYGFMVLRDRLVARWQGMDRPRLYDLNYAGADRKNR